MAREQPAFPPPRDLTPGGVNYQDEPPPPPFAPRRAGVRADLEKLAFDIERPPLKGVAESIAGLKFHELMEMANAINGSTTDKSPNYDLASSLSAWALGQLK
jgi:hypothetical protein